MKLRRLITQGWLTLTMRSSAGYWNSRYGLGLSSGEGSEGLLARYKADVLNAFVSEHGIQRVVEFGCGDGQQLARANYPSYLGLDVSAHAIELCRTRFATDPGRSFLHYDPGHSVNLGGYLDADLVLSLDVIYHLVEDEAYLSHLRDVFAVARRHVAIYASNEDERGRLRHVRHRRFLDDVLRKFPEFQLMRHLENPHRELSCADFYFFARRSSTSA